MLERDHEPLTPLQRALAAAIASAIVRRIKQEANTVTTVTPRRRESLMADGPEPGADGGGGKSRRSLELVETARRVKE